MATTGELIGLLRSSYPNANVGPETVSAYVRLLSDVSPEELEPVVVAIVRTQPRFPTIAELIGAVLERRLSLPAPDQAWSRACSPPEVFAVSELTEPEREALETVGGRYAIKTSETPSITRSQFLKAYEASRRRTLEQANLASLDGARALRRG